MCKRALINSGWNKDVAQSEAAAAPTPAEVEWVQCLLGTGSSVVRSRRQGDCSSELRALRPHFVNDSMIDQERGCTVYQSTVFLPRVCPIREIEGPFARSAKRAQELAALVRQDETTDTCVLSFTILTDVLASSLCSRLWCAFTVFHHHSSVSVYLSSEN